MAGQKFGRIILRLHGLTGHKTQCSTSRLTTVRASSPPPPHVSTAGGRVMDLTTVTMRGLTPSAVRKSALPVAYLTSGASPAKRLEKAISSSPAATGKTAILRYMRGQC